MSPTKHTPGPWQIEIYHGQFFRIIRERQAGETPAYRVDADARLIAAAPDLLSACEGILTSFHASVKTDAALAAVVAAVNRAKNK